MCLVVSSSVYIANLHFDPSRCDSLRPQEPPRQEDKAAVRTCDQHTLSCAHTYIHALSFIFYDILDRYLLDLFCNDIYYGCFSF